MGHLNFLSLVLSGSGTVTLGAVLFRFDSSFLGKHFTSKRKFGYVSYFAVGMVIKNM